MTPHVYVNTLRAETACLQLAQVDERTSLGRLAEDLGFSDQGHFTRFFRENHHFEHLRDEVLPGLIARAKAGETSRVTSAPTAKLNATDSPT